MVSRPSESTSCSDYNIIFLKIFRLKILKFQHFILLQVNLIFLFTSLRTVSTEFTKICTELFDFDNRPHFMKKNNEKLYLIWLIVLLGVIYNGKFLQSIIVTILNTLLFRTLRISQRITFTREKHEDLYEQALKSLGNIMCFREKNQYRFKFLFIILAQESEIWHRCFIENDLSKNSLIWCKWGYFSWFRGIRSYMIFNAHIHICMCFIYMF